MLALALLLALAAPAQQALPAVKAPALEVDDDFGPSTPGWLAHRFARISEALLVVPDGGTLETPTDNLILGNTLITLGGAPASSNLVADNRIEGSIFRGILLFGAGTEDNELRGNRIANCARGIELSAAPGNRVLENTLIGNPTGLFSSAASGNLFARNDLAGPLEAQDLGSSEWDDGSQGNYWQSYTGLDLDDDGIGDTPHAISGGEQDRFPLMAQQGPLMLSSSARTLSAVTGGQVTFTLHAGAAHAGRAYLLLGSASGTAPGIPLPGGLVLPIAHDPFTAYVQANLGSPEFFGFQGVLDGTGSATAVWTPAPLGAASVGLHLEFAWTLVGPWERVSHPLSLELVE